MDIVVRVAASAHARLQPVASQQGLETVRHVLDALIRMKHSISARPSTVDRQTKRFPGEGCGALFAQRLEESPIKREGHCDAGDEKSYPGQPID